MRSNQEGLITYLRFEPIFMILAIGLALLSNAAMSMNAPDEHVAKDAAVSNVTEEQHEYEECSNCTTAEPPGYQDRAAKIPCFGYCSGLVTLLLAYSLISLRR
jgi:hypothetical protein